MGNCCGIDKQSSQADIASSIEPMKIERVKPAKLAKSDSFVNLRIPDNYSRIKRPSQISEPNLSLYKPTQTAKVLLLGASESGKSTLVRQIKIINGHSFSDDELLRYKKIIRSSCLELFALLVSEYVPIQNTTSEWKELCYDFLTNLAKSKVIERELMESAVTLWSDPIIQEYLADEEAHRKLKQPQSKNIAQYDSSVGESRILRFCADDPAYHFLPSMDRIMSKGYSPNNADILSVRIPTTGIVETWFQRGEVSIGLIDVGGQRSERKKWLHCFETVNTLLFVVSMSEYDQMLEEDHTVNRMKESIKLFASVSNVKWFAKASMLLFLNKRDVFDDKILYSPLNQCFETYDGTNDKDEAASYISTQFMSQSRTGRNVYRHYTCAKDSENISVVFDAVSDVITQQILIDVGLI